MRARSVAATVVGVFTSALLAGSMNASASPIENHQLGQDIRAWEHTGARQGARVSPKLTDAVSGIDVSGYQGNVD